MTHETLTPEALAVQAQFEGFIYSRSALSQVKNQLVSNLSTPCLPKPGECGFKFGVFPTRDKITPELAKKLIQLPDGAYGLTLAVGGTNTVVSLVQKQGDTYHTIADSKIATPQGSHEHKMDYQTHYDEVAHHVANFITDDTIKRQLGDNIPTIIVSPTGPMDQNGISLNSPNLSINIPLAGIDSARELSERIAKEIKKDPKDVNVYAINDLCVLTSGVQLAIPHFSLKGEAVGIVSGTGYGIALTVPAFRLKQLYPNDEGLKNYDDNDLVIINTEDGHHDTTRPEKPHPLDELVLCGCDKINIQNKHTETLVAGGSITRQVAAIVEKLHTQKIIPDDFAELVKNRVFRGIRNNKKGIETKDLVDFLSNRAHDYNPIKMNDLFGRELKQHEIQILRIIMDNLITHAGYVTGASYVGYSEAFFNESNPPLILAGGMFECQEFKKAFDDACMELTGSKPTKVAGDNMQTISMGVLSMAITKN